jgi:GR25 family glycosyltransferase involved in LPS biosynthesis
MTPGTAAYALTPSGAKKILYAAKKRGLEQSDFIINSANIRLQYVYPSPVKYNVVNLQSSHGIVK